MCIFVRISVYFADLGLVIGIVFYIVPCIYFVLFSVYYITLILFALLAL